MPDATVNYFPADVLATGALTAGRVPYVASDGSLSDDTGLLFDAAADRLTVPNIAGSSSASGTLQVSSTSNATKGTITIGGASTGVTVDEANSRIIIGSATANGTNPTARLQIRGGSSATARLAIDDTVTFGSVGADRIGTESAHDFLVRSNATSRIKVSSGGNIVLGAEAALATTATDGFAYVPTCAGAPTGVPTSYTGKVALVFDTTNNRLYAYDGGWLSAAFA